MAGQNNHFSNYAREKLPYAIERYVKETNRLFGVLNKRLSDREFVAGEYTIADMAAYPWTVPHERLGQSLDDFPHLKRWFEAIKARPATVRAYEKAKAINAQPTVSDEDPEGYCSAKPQRWWQAGLIMALRLYDLAGADPGAVSAPLLADKACACAQGTGRRDGSVPLHRQGRDRFFRTVTRPGVGRWRSDRLGIVGDCDLSGGGLCGSSVTVRRTCGTNNNALH
jgi:hypothetical protein